MVGRAGLPSGEREVHIEVRGFSVARRNLEPTPDTSRNRMRYILTVLAAFAVATPIVAQQELTVTVADYARGESFLRASTTPLVLGTTGRPTMA